MLRFFRCCSGSTRNRSVMDQSSAADELKKRAAENRIKMLEKRLRELELVNFMHSFDIITTETYEERINRQTECQNISREIGRIKNNIPQLDNQLNFSHPSRSFYPKT